MGKERKIEGDERFVEIHFSLRGQNILKTVLMQISRNGSKKRRILYKHYIIARIFSFQKLREMIVRCKIILAKNK
jgi:hypothetical protein